MAAERVAVCLQLTYGKHDDIIDLLLPEGRSVNKNQILIDALTLYLNYRKSGPSTPPKPPAPPVAPFDPSGLALALKEGIRDGMREIAPAIGQAVAAAVGTGFSVNRVEIPPDPVALAEDKKAALLEDMMNGLQDWGAQ